VLNSRVLENEDNDSTLRIRLIVQGESISKVGAHRCHEQGQAKRSSQRFEAAHDRRFDPAPSHFCESTDLGDIS